ncbi:MAG: PQQ-binding-like beta-propeller repeat protein [Pirellula sp.]
MKLSDLSLVLLLVSFVPTLAFAENWPQWRGLRSDGVSSEKKIPTTWSKSQNVAWRTPMPGQAGATPCIWDDRIYVTSSDNDDLVVLCLNVADGTVRWKRTVGSGNQNARAGEGNSASPSPSTDGKHVWVFFGTGALACYTKDGDEVWKTNVNDRFGKIEIQFGMTSTPVLDGDHLYLQLIHGRMQRGDSSRTGKVIKLEKMTGKTVWEVDRVTAAEYECKHSYASPFLYDDKKSRFLVAHGADCITGHDLTDGKEIWRFGALNGPTNINSKPNDPTFRFVASPLVSPANNAIIVPTAKGGPAIALNVPSLRGESSAIDSAVKWNSPRTPDVSIPLIVDDLVYLLNKDGMLQCLELSTGNEVYLMRTHTAQHRSSPMYADGHIYFGSKDGHFTVVKAGREFEIVSSIEMGEAITASAIVSNGTLYIRSYEALYAIR